MIEKIDFLVRFWELKARNARCGEPAVCFRGAGGAGARLDADGAAVGFTRASRRIGDHGARRRGQTGAEFVEKHQKSAVIGGHRHAGSEHRKDQRTRQIASDAGHEGTIVMVVSGSAV